MRAIKAFNDLWADEYEEWEIHLLALSLIVGTILLAGTWLGGAGL